MVIARRKSLGAWIFHMQEVLRWPSGNSGVEMSPGAWWATMTMLVFSGEQAETHKTTVNLLSLSSHVTENGRGRGDRGYTTHQWSLIYQFLFLFPVVKLYCRCQVFCVVILLSLLYCSFLQSVALFSSYCPVFCALPYSKVIHMFYVICPFPSTRLIGRSFVFVFCDATSRWDKEYMNN